MNIYEKFKDASKGVKLNENPNSNRYTFINSNDAIIRQNLNAYKVWYIGNSDELLNYYTNAEMYDFTKNIIYNRNNENYFWSLSTREANIKRVHSGLPRAIVDTLVNAIGVPTIDCADERLADIIEMIDLPSIINQQQMPLTLVEGWGAYKVCFNKKDRYLGVQYYEADDVDFITEHGNIIGCCFRDYYKVGDYNYVLFDTRKVENGNSIIKYELFRLDKNDNVSQVDLSEVPCLKHLAGENSNVEIKGFTKPLCVASRFFYNCLNKDYGRSIFEGKLDIFDDIDQCWSILSRTTRLSTPVEYIKSALLRRDNNGNAILPDRFDREYVEDPSLPDGDGNSSGGITTTQPPLNTQQYTDSLIQNIQLALTGVLSPATMGIDIAKKDNAEAQREKEKITIMTRDNIIHHETRLLKELCNLLLKCSDFMVNDAMTLVDYDISVKFNEFATPTFDSKATTLLSLWNAGAISPKMFIEKLYGDSLSDDEKAAEVENMESKSQEDNLQFNDMMGGGEDEFATSMGDQANTETAIK